MQIPSNIIKAVAEASQASTVAHAQLMRDAEFWAHVVTWQQDSRFKRDKAYAYTLRMDGPSVARKAYATHGPKAERALLDMGHRVRHNVEAVLIAAAIFSLRNMRNNG